MSYDEFQDPPQPGRFTPAEWLGHLLLCEPQRYLESVMTANGPSDAIEGTITVLTAQGGPHVIVGARVFQNQLIASLREAIGQRPVLGRLGQGQAQPGKNAAWILTPTSPEDKQYASSYLASRQAQQFTEPSQFPQSQGIVHTGGAPTQVYAPPGVTTNVVQQPTLQPQYASTYDRARVEQAQTPAQPPTPAPQPPAPAPAQATPPVPVTPAGPVAQAGAQAPSSVPEMDDEQFAGMPEDVQKLLDAARYARLHSA